MRFGQGEVPDELDRRVGQNCVGRGRRNAEFSGARLGVGEVQGGQRGIGFVEPERPRGERAFNGGAPLVSF
jgi:hypothetical protein